MESQSTPSKWKRGLGVHAHLEGLGLQTYNEKNSTRAIFKYEPVIRLYKLEIPSLFGVLLRDQGTILNREDPMLFDKELGTLLVEYGPLIWPAPGQGSREHLRVAQTGTHYEGDLIFPRDFDILKDRLRGLILVKRQKADTDIEALIEKRHRDTRMRVLKIATNSISVTPAKRASTCDSAEKSDSEDSVMGTTTRSRAFHESVSSHVGFTSVELRLYRKTSTTLPGAYGPVQPYGSMFLTPDCTTSHDCFKRVSDKIGENCVFVVFQLSEEMGGVPGGVRIVRGQTDADSIFQGVLEKFRTARKFPGEPQYRSVEVELGIEKRLIDERI